MFETLKLCASQCCKGFYKSIEKPKKTIAKNSNFTVWMAAWLPGLLAGLMAGLLPCWLAACWLAGVLARLLAGLLAGRSGLLADWMAGSLVAS